jgi:hypothetical protein
MYVKSVFLNNLVMDSSFLPEVCEGSPFLFFWYRMIFGVVWFGLCLF